MHRLLAAVVISAAVAACSGEAAPPLALVASSNASLEVGNQRIVLGLMDPETQEFLAAPDVAATADFVGPSGETVESVPLDFIWAVPEIRGLYRGVVDFPAPGAWSVTISAEGYAPTEAALIMVNAETTMPQVGDTAPPVVTRTSADADLTEISTDPEPDPAFYELSVDAALADDRPTVFIFATPAFCTSQTCGPMLELAKELAPAHPDADFVHVEIYENLDAASFDELIPVEAVDVWSLPSEPWVFVTDAGGVITARFEGVVDSSELAGALADLGV